MEYYYYKRSVYKQWDYIHYRLTMDKVKDEETGENDLQLGDLTITLETFSKLAIYDYVHMIPASEKHRMMEQDKHSFGGPPEDVAPTWVVTAVNGETGNKVLLRNNPSIVSDATSILQNQLNEFLGGSLRTDGRFGDNTEEAIKNAQSKLGLPQTGVLDLQTLYQLELSTTIKGKSPQVTIHRPQPETVSKEPKPSGPKDPLAEISGAFSTYTGVDPGSSTPPPGEFASAVLGFLILDDIETLADGEFTYEDLIAVGGMTPFGKGAKVGKVVITEFSDEAAEVFDKVKDSIKGKGDGGRQTVKSSLGKEIDITPSSKHTTTTKNPGLNGEPNTSVDILDSKTGEIKTRRYYGPDGKATRDIDMTDHGNPKQHPDVPHEHIFEYNPDGSLKSR
jgi:peptidoglycan hydrolase-like protein with peptidoglycan-binding domain